MSLFSPVSCLLTPFSVPYALCFYLLFAACCLVLTDSSFLKPIVEYGPGAANSSPDGYCFGWTVHGAGTAFHAIISVQNLNTVTIEAKNPMDAYLSTHPTKGALISIKLQSYNIS